MNGFCYNHIFKIHNFQNQFNIFEPNVFKWVIKKQFKGNDTHLVEKKTFEKKKGLLILKV
jgi:hypothetical protein